MVEECIRQRPRGVPLKIDPGELANRRGCVSWVRHFFHQPLDLERVVRQRRLRVECAYILRSIPRPAPSVGPVRDQAFR
jgi:hypothetical protein